jgi:hypothetical protein
MEKPAESVFLNIPYDRDFESLYLAYVVGLVRLGFEPRVTVAVPNDIGRLDTIIDLIQHCEYSIHDLSRIQPSASGIPRFNMPLELGLALYRSRTTTKEHRVYIFEQENYRIQQSTSDLNGLDPWIHDGTPKGVMSQLRNVFLRESEASTAPQMMAAYRAIKRALPRMKEKAGVKSLFTAAVFRDIVLAANILKKEEG